MTVMASQIIGNIINLSVAGWFSSRRASNAECVSMWWRHHAAVGKIMVPVNWFTITWKFIIVHLLLYHRPAWCAHILLGYFVWERFSWSANIIINHLFYFQTLTCIDHNFPVKMRTHHRELSCTIVLITLLVSLLLVGPFSRKHNALYT